jgi:long-subunit fatty acid transport protein
MLGAGYKLTGKLSVNAAYESGLNSSETASNPSIIANEYNGSTSQLSTNLFHVSLAWIL